MRQAKREYSKDPESEWRSFMVLGKLTFAELKEAKAQMDTPSLAKDDLWTLNRELFMAYNDAYRRNLDNEAVQPSAEDGKYFHQVIQELIDGINPSPDYELFHAELLRESGRMEEAKAILSRHKDMEDTRVKAAILRHIEANDTMPFLLMQDGKEME